MPSTNAVSTPDFDKKETERKEVSAREKKKRRRRKVEKRGSLLLQIVLLFQKKGRGKKKEGRCGGEGVPHECVGGYGERAARMEEVGKRKIGWGNHIF